MFVDLQVLKGDQEDPTYLLLMVEFYLLGDGICSLIHICSSQCLQNPDIQVDRAYQVAEKLMLIIDSWYH